jgi:hypothetical protein
MLYSLSAVTSYGHTRLILEPQWQLMGALEALNGMLLLGLTTAFLLARIQKVVSLGKGGQTISTQGAIAELLNSAIVVVVIMTSE